MNIAIVFDAMLYGGIERVGVNYIKLLKEEGHTVTVYILNPNDIEGIIEEIPKSCRIVKRRISPFICPERYWYIAKRWWWGKLIFPFAFLFLRIVMEIYKLTFLHYKKSDIAIAFAGHFNDLSFVAYNFIKSGKKMCWLHGGLYSYMIISPGYERLYQKIKNLIVLNNVAENECLFYNKFLHLNINKIYNSTRILEMQIDYQKVNELKMKYGDFVLMICRMDSPKNPLSVVKAMEYIYNKYKLQRHLVFVGDGPLLKTYKEFSSHTSIADYCHFVGNDANPQNYYKAAHLFAFSSFTEGMPTVLIEAACFGLPIATSDTSVREILGDGEYGLISPINNFIALGENIYSLLSNKELYDKYATQAKKRSKDFLPDTIKIQLKNLMKNLS